MADKTPAFLYANLGGEEDNAQKSSAEIIKFFGSSPVHMKNRIRNETALFSPGSKYKTLFNTGRFCKQLKHASMESINSQQTNRITRETSVQLNGRK